MNLLYNNTHILEFKNRFVLVSLTWFATFCISYSFKEIILFNIVNTFFITNPYFILTDITELFNVYLKLSLFISNQVLIIISFYHIIMFLAPGLYKTELKRLKNFRFFLTIPIIGLLITKYLSIPLMNKFFYGFQEVMNNSSNIPMFFEAKVAEYVNFFIGVYVLNVFSIIALITMIQIIGVLAFKFNNPQKKNMRKLFYLIFLILSTIVTPPDVVSQLIMTFLLINIYEVILLLFHILILIR